MHQNRICGPRKSVELNTGGMTSEHESDGQSAHESDDQSDDQSIEQQIREGVEAGVLSWHGERREDDDHPGNPYTLIPYP